MDITNINLLTDYAKEELRLDQLSKKIVELPIGASPEVEEFIDLSGQHSRTRNELTGLIGDSVFECLDKLKLFNNANANFERNTNYLIHSNNIKVNEILPRIENEVLKCCVKRFLIDREDFIDRFPVDEEMNSGIKNYYELEQFEKRLEEFEYRQMLFLPNLLKIDYKDKGAVMSRFCLYQEEISQYLISTIEYNRIRLDVNVLDDIRDSVINYITDSMHDFKTDIVEMIEVFQDTFKNELKHSQKHNDFLNKLRSIVYEIRYTTYAIEEVL